MELKGTFTALVTPFKKGTIDEEGLAQNIALQLESGVNGLVALGTTGECPTLTKEEQKKVISIAVKQAKGLIPVIVGTGYYSTHKTIEYTKMAKDLGADGALIVAPYYNRPTQEGIFLHYQKIASEVDFPIIAYNVPKRTGVNIEPRTIQRLATLKNIVGLKDDIEQLSEILQLVPMNILSHSDMWTVPMMAIGAKGVISVISNLVPKKVVAKVNAALRGDFEEARKWHDSLFPLMHGSFIESNPVPIKTMMHLAGLAAGELRLPLCPPSAANTKILEELVRKL